jgi:CO/xanthine dehydrogenase FAD-binding subunit
LKSPPFEYARATSIEEACGLLHQHGDAAKLIAGGQSLVPMMAFRLLRPSWLIDINEIAALKFVAFETDTVRMGACTR